LGVASNAAKRKFPRMSKTAVLTDQEARHKARAQEYLAETQRILRELATERRRAERRRPDAVNITEKIKAILQEA
jgi:hypothetical protein